MYPVSNQRVRIRPGNVKLLISQFVTAVTVTQMESIPSQVKRPFDNKSGYGKFRKEKRTKREKNIRAGGSSADVLAADVQSLLHNLNIASEESRATLPQLWTEVTVKIETLSSTGDGLGRTSPQSAHILAVPFTAPGDLVVAKVVAHVQGPETYSRADFVKVLEPSPHRDNSLVKCRYFGSCSGCQLQMLSYSYQLAHKKRIIEKAYRNFSGLSSDLIPPVGDTIGSPLQYGYRTKLTPHFDSPKFARKLGRKGEKAHFEEVPPIGFHKKQTRSTIDIEECPISTEAIQMGLQSERARVKADLGKYSKGATLLLRESTKRIQQSQVPMGVEIPGTDEKTKTTYEFSGPYIHAKSCVTDPRSTFTEYVGDFQIKNAANSFFQNNSSILPAFVSYIRSHVPSASVSSNTARTTNLIDAYSGSGLFSITLSSLFKRTIGIDIDNLAISQARANVEANLDSISTLAMTARGEQSVLCSAKNRPSDVNSVQNHEDQDHYNTGHTHQDAIPHGENTPESQNSNEYPQSRPEFIASDASQLFAAVKSFNPAETVVILDPPRKGCDESFLEQLLDFGPERIVYVSCNVHTQAADVGRLLTGRVKLAENFENGPTSGEKLPKKDREDESSGTIQPMYEIETLQGFDFFPQTSHVESVAVLTRKRAQTFTAAE